MYAERTIQAVEARTQVRTQIVGVRPAEVIGKTTPTVFRTVRTQISPLFSLLLSEKEGEREEGERWRKG